MSFTFRKAVREATTCNIAISGSTGSGKTMSALLIARGLAGPEGRIAFIDTEARRGLHYAPKPGEEIGPGTFDFEHCDFGPPFSPERYSEVIAASQDFDVIVIDNASHEWAGDGGVLDLRDAEWAKSNYKESKSIQTWIKPKGAHKRMMSKLLQSRAHIVFCLRAEEKMLIGKGGKITPIADRPVAERWEPICEKNFMYEMLASVVVLASNPGVPIPVKVHQQHRGFFDFQKPIDESVGERIAAWAAGGAKPPETSPLEAAEEWASQGRAAFREWFANQGPKTKQAIEGDLPRLKEIATKAGA